jgi:hypothetical protein
VYFKEHLGYCDGGHFARVNVGSMQLFQKLSGKWLVDTSVLLIFIQLTMEVAWDIHSLYQVSEIMTPI